MARGSRARGSQHLVRVRQRRVGESTAPAATGRHGPCGGQGGARTWQLPQEAPVPWLPRQSQAELPPVRQLPRPAPACCTAWCPEHGDAWHRSGTKGTGSSSASESWKPRCSCSRSPDRNNIPAHASCICCPDARPRVGWDRILQLDPGPFLANRTVGHGLAALPALPVPSPACLP